MDNESGYSPSFSEINNQPKDVFQKVENNDEEKKEFTSEEMEVIESKRRILSSLAYFIGKDFQMPVELNEPGAGWHWDFKANIVRVDPKDLLDKPMDYLRFVISHEGGHRRISRTEFIPLEVWRQPGFSFMLNAIEDPRDNNFVAENYPKFREQMNLAYEMDLDLSDKLKEKAKTKLGHQPRFMQAGFEYIKQWFREQKGEELAIDESLSEEVREVVTKTIESARASWWTYPSREEADQDEEIIKEYAEASYKINLNRIWPEFKKLIEKDLEDQATQELLDDMQKEGGGGDGLPQEMQDALTPEEQKELEEAIDKALEETKNGAGEENENKELEAEGTEGKPQEGEGKKGKHIDLDSLSPELKQKIREFIDSLPDDKKQELKERAEKAISDFEKELNEEIAGKMSESPEKKEGREETEPPMKEEEERFTEGETQSVVDYRNQLESELKKDANIYEEKRREVLPVIDKLENELRAIFRARRERRWETGKKSGPTINIQHRIGEIAQGIPAIDSRAWQRREKPAENDYAISILVDLSGSMQGEKINETFKAVIVLAEVLNRLSIRTEILGFNDRIYEYQNFNDQMSNQIRETMGGILEEVNDMSDTGKAQWNDDGWALKQASDRLERQKEAEKFLIVLSDGEPIESPLHPRNQFELSIIVGKILKSTKQKLVGLGIGPNTDHVSNYYPNSLVSSNVSEMAENLAALIKEVIENSGKF